MEGAEAIFNVCVTILKRLAEHGLIHCDFNEFNLMTNSDGLVTMIDFPQMVSTNHPNAVDLFQRDVNGLVKFFAMKMKYVPPEDLIPKLEDIIASDERLDEEVRACGKFSREDDEELIRYINFENDLQSAPTISGTARSEDDDDVEDEAVESGAGFNEGVFGSPQHGQSRPNRNTATYDHDFSCDSMSSRGGGGGGGGLTTRADTRNSTAASAAVSDEEDSQGDPGDVSDGSDGDAYDERGETESAAPSSAIDIRLVKENIKRYLIRISLLYLNASYLCVYLFILHADTEISVNGKVRLEDQTKLRVGRNTERLTGQIAPATFGVKFYSAGVAVVTFQIKFNDECVRGNKSAVCVGLPKQSYLVASP